jgi:hypothetical protein
MVKGIEEDTFHRGSNVDYRDCCGFYLDHRDDPETAVPLIRSCYSGFVVSDDDPQQFLMVETWESRQKYETYFAWRVETGVIADMNALLERELELRFFNRIGACACARRKAA